MLCVCLLLGCTMRLPLTEGEWELDLRVFIKNYEFPCVSAWDGFHVYVSSKLKQSYSFKKHYTITNLALVGKNNRILYAAIEILGSTHDGRMLQSAQLYQVLTRGNVVPNNIQVHLEGSGEIPLCTIGDSTFPRHSWLLKGFPKKTIIPQQCHFNKKFWSVCVVTENTYGMLKGSWKTLYKKTEYQLFHLELIIMACTMLHNLCIDHNDLCETRWCQEVLHLRLVKSRGSWQENKEMPGLNKMKIYNWLWNLASLNSLTISTKKLFY